MTAAGVTSLGVATASLASGDQNIGQAFQTLMNPANTFDFIQKNPEAAAILNKFKNGEFNDIESSKNAMNQLASALGVNVDVLTTTITDVYGLKGTTDKNIIAIDVNGDNRKTNIEVLEHEVSHNQGLSNELLSNLSGKAGELGFTAGITYNKAAVEYYQKQIGDGNDINTQLNNDAILNKDNQKIFDQLNSEPNSFENYTTTNRAVAFSEKINAALKGNNPNEAKRLLDLYADYVSKTYVDYKNKLENKGYFQKVDIKLDGVAHKAGYPTMLSGPQLNQLFSMFPKGSAEYAEVQKLVRMQNEVYTGYKADLYQMDAQRDINSVYIYPDDKRYGALPDSYKKEGITNSKAYIDQLKADEGRGVNAIIGSAISPLGALGSSTRLLGVDDKTADHLAIGGAVIGTLVGSAFVGKVITPIATSKNEAIISKTNVTNSKTDINVYPLQTPVKSENILVNPKTGLKEVQPKETVLDTHAKLNQYDQGKLKPADAATGAQLESVLGSMKKYEGTTTTKNPDWEITSGPNKGKTVDAMYTTDKLSQKEIDGLNKYYEKNMTISKSEGERPSEINNIQKHLGKADFVPIDFRVLNEANQKIFLNYVKTLPRSQQAKFIIIKE